MRFGLDGLLDTRYFEADEWKFIERLPYAHRVHGVEALMSVANGYLGMRGNHDNGQGGGHQGTFVNGFHETWSPSQIAPARAGVQGQQIVNVPDACTLRVYVDDEPFRMRPDDLVSYERILDMRNGQLVRALVWRAPSGKQVEIRNTRMASFVHPHLALVTVDIRMIDGRAPITVSSQLINRQDAEYEPGTHEGAPEYEFDRRVLEPRLRISDTGVNHEGDIALGFRCRESRMSIVAAYRHRVTTDVPHSVVSQVEDDVARTLMTFEGQPGQTIRIEKYISYHTSGGDTSADELAGRCRRTLDRAFEQGAVKIETDQRRWLEDWWDRCDIRLRGDERLQWLLRFNLFHLAQATGSASRKGVPSRGLTGRGDYGHNGWENDVLLVPFLSVTSQIRRDSLFSSDWMHWIRPEAAPSKNVMPARSFR